MKHPFSSKYILYIDLPLFDYCFISLIFLLSLLILLKCWMILIDDNLVILKFFVLMEQYLIKDTDRWYTDK